MKDVNILKNNGVNIEKSLEIFGDMETYDEMLVTFNLEVYEKLEKIQNFKEAGDMSNYAILVHSLKSDAKYFGFEVLAELSYQHELESKENNMFYVYENYAGLMLEAKKIVAVVGQYLGDCKEFPVDIDESKSDKTILIVDDSLVVRTFLNSIFANHFNILMAKDGMEAINIINENSNVDLLFLDLQMPNVNGIAVLNYFKENGLFDRTKVCVITGVENGNITDYLENYPIVGKLDKPFNENDIKDIIEKVNL